MIYAEIFENSCENLEDFNKILNLIYNTRGLSDKNNKPLVTCEKHIRSGFLRKKIDQESKKQYDIISFNDLYQYVMCNYICDNYSYPNFRKLIKDLYEIRKQQKSEIDFNIKQFLNMIYEVVNSPESDLKHSNDRFHDIVIHISRSIMMVICEYIDEENFVGCDINEIYVKDSSKIDKDKLPYFENLNIEINRS